MERNTTGSFLLTSSSLTFIIFLSLFVPTLFFLSSSSSLSPSSSSAPALPTRFRRSASFVFAASASLSLSLFLIPSRRRCTEFWLPSFGYRVFQCVFHEKRKKRGFAAIGRSLVCHHSWKPSIITGASLLHTHTHTHTLDMQMRRRYANATATCHDRRARAISQRVLFSFLFFCHRSIENSVINEKLGN